MFSGWQPDQQAYDTSSWQFETGDDGTTAARPDPEPSALRLPASQTALRALHTGDGRRGLRRAARAVPRRRREVHGLFRSRQDRDDLLRRRSHAAFRRRADRSHRRDPPVAARQRRPSRRRRAGAARPRVDSGLDGHSDALRPAARLSADAGVRHRVLDARSLHHADAHADRHVVPLRRLHRQSAEGVVRRRGDS